MIEGGPGQDKFYLTLPSDSSKAYFDKQDASHFFTKLHGGIRLDQGEWMVGLAKITYPATYDNIPVSELLNTTSPTSPMRSIGAGAQ